MTEKKEHPLKGRKQSAEHVEKRRQAILNGRSAERTKKRSETMKKLWKTDEYRAQFVGCKHPPLSEESLRRVREAVKTRKLPSKEAIKRRNEAVKKAWENPELRQKQRELQQRIWEDPERLKKHLRKLEAEWLNDDYRDRQSASRVAAWTAERKQHQKEVMEQIWSDPDYKNNTVAAWYKVVSAAPNGIEKMVIKICEDCNLPFKFVGGGAGKVVIDGRIPDFIRTDGKKQQIIEVFGDYWHEGDTGEIRAKAFASLGYETLVIWEHELHENIADVIERLIKFT